MSISRSQRQVTPTNEPSVAPNQPNPTTSSPVKGPSVLNTQSAFNIAPSNKSHVSSAQEINNAYGAEVIAGQKVVGPMPLPKFLCKFLPLETLENEDAKLKNPFRTVRKGLTDQERLNKMVSPLILT